MPRVLLLLPTTTYRAPDFLEAASRLGLEVTVASEEPSAVEGLNPEGLLTLDFGDPASCAGRVARLAARLPVAAVVGVDEETALVASVVSEALGLPHNPRPAAEAARNKARLRERLSAAGVPTPPHRLFHVGEDPAALSSAVSYPCVVKPTFLSGSRGVIRADDAGGFVAAWRRIARILREPEVARKGGEAAREILVEDFVPGREFAVEGLLRGGVLRVLALFDKPDPLDGPFFEETIYVTPSRLPAQDQDRIRRLVGEGAAALGLVDGPVHAELRHGPEGSSLIELAARSIGGLCSRTLSFGAGMSLEELILRHALGLEIPTLERERRAAGVMMIPIPGAGMLERIEGVERARGVPDVAEVTISARPGQRLVPLPEGSRYLGFLFSRAATPERAEAALREAHSLLKFRITA